MHGKRFEEGDGFLQLSFSLPPAARHFPEVCAPAAAPTGPRSPPVAQMLRSSKGHLEQIDPRQTAAGRRYFCYIFSTAAVAAACLVFLLALAGEP